MRNFAPKQKLMTRLAVLLSFLVDLSHHVSVDEYMFFELLKVRVRPLLLCWWSKLPMLRSCLLLFASTKTLFSRVCYY